jgi:alpha-1,2-mannosyltransferase
MLKGPGPVLVLVVAAAAAGALRGGFTDLSVYQYGGRAVLDGLPVSGDPATGLPFTYPPFAAVVMVPWALLPAWLAAALWTGASLGALAAAVVVVRRALDRPAPGWLVAVVAGGALALEPVWQNLTFGQVNLFLMLAVLVDLVGPARRWSGVLVGIAAGVKLTPLVFVVLLVLVGRRRAAGRAALAFAGTVAVGFVVMPGSAATYWADGLVDAGRVGPPALAHNQSVYGALSRLLDGPPPTLLWLAVAGPLSLAVLVVGAVRWRCGDRVLGTCLGAMAMLLVSPISWSHHWVWAVPVALALWERSRWAGAAWTAVFVARPVVWPPYGQDREYGWSPADHLVGNAYLLTALVLSVWAGATVNRRVGSSARRTATAPNERIPAPRYLNQDRPPPAP